MVPYHTRSKSVPSLRGRLLYHQRFDLCWQWVIFSYNIFTDYFFGNHGKCWYLWSTLARCHYRRDVQRQTSGLRKKSPKIFEPCSTGVATAEYGDWPLTAHSKKPNKQNNRLASDMHKHSAAIVRVDNTLNSLLIPTMRISPLLAKSFIRRIITGSTHHEMEPRSFKRTWSVFWPVLGPSTHTTCPQEKQRSHRFQRWPPCGHPWASRLLFQPKDSKLHCLHNSRGRIQRRNPKCPNWLCELLVLAFAFIICQERVGSIQ